MGRYDGRRQIGPYHGCEEQAARVGLAPEGPPCPGHEERGVARHDELEEDERLYHGHAELEHLVGYEEQDEGTRDARQTQHGRQDQYAPHVPPSRPVPLQHVIIGYGQYWYVVQYGEQDDHYGRYRVEAEEQYGETDEEQYPYGLRYPVDDVVLHTLEYLPGLLYGIGYDGKPGLEQGYVGRRPGRVRGTSDRYAALGLLKSRCVVYAVARHGDSMALPLHDFVFSGNYEIP